MKKLLHLFTITIVVSFLSCCALFLLPPSSTVEASESVKQETIVVSRQQYIASMKTLRKQETVLLKLKRKMELLDMPLTEQLALLEKCENELSEAKQILESQENSLTSAYNLIAQLRQDSEKLRLQVNRLIHQNNHRQHQRDTYATIAAALGLIILF